MEVGFPAMRFSFIDPIHKWLPIKNSFVSIKISPTKLVLELIIQKNFYFQTRLVGLIQIHTKEFLIGNHLCIGSIVRSFSLCIA